MADFTVASVPYVNAAPLVTALEFDPALGVDVIFGLPSTLPALLEAGSADAILVSSFEALTQPRMRVVGGVCIGSHGTVDSVRLFSSKPYDQIKTLALDSASMTSNRLAQIILAEGYGIQPQTILAEPNLEQMMQHADACILIGDIGHSTDPGDLEVLDLGDAWSSLTSLPFVWAMWTGHEGITPDLAYRLQTAAARSGFWDGNEELIDFTSELEWETARRKVALHAAERAGWELYRTMTYLEERIWFEMGPREWEGLKQFASYLSKWKLAPVATLPEVISPLHLGMSSR